MKNRLKVYSPGRPTSGRSGRPGRFLLAARSSSSRKKGSKRRSSMVVLRGSCSELVLVDQNPAKAEAEAADIGDAGPVSHPVRVSSGFASRGETWDAASEAELAGLVRGAAGRIIAGKGVTAYGVGAALARIVEAVLGDARAVLTVSAPSERYGVSLSLPRLVGGGGVLATLEPPLSDGEAAALEASAAVLREAAGQL